MVTRALVVQSCPDVARTVCASLAEVDVEATVVSDGPAAIVAAATLGPDVVLVDLTLPPLDGWYVLAALGALVDGPLLVARVAHSSDSERAIALGADAWVDRDVHVVAAAGRLAATIAA